MKLGFYPGCSLEGGSREYSESVVALAKAFDIELVQVPDWNCCGATAAHNLNRELSLSLPARILALAEKEGMKEIVVPCAACYNRLTLTQHELNHEKGLKEKISEHIDLPLSSEIQILNVIQFIEKYIIKDLKYKLISPLTFKSACYYGCLLVRPHDILKFDRVEDPQTMDVVMNAIGPKTIDWNYKTECCGAGFSVSKTDVVSRLSGTLIKDAVDCGADAIIVACPMCHSNLDMRRPEINEYLGKEYSIPVIYITQAIGMAVGIDEKSLGLQRHFVEVDLRHTRVESHPGVSTKSLEV